MDLNCVTSKLIIYYVRIIAIAQTIPGPSETPVIGPTLLQSIEEIVIPCTIPTAYSTNQTTGKIRFINNTIVWQ